MKPKDIFTIFAILAALLLSSCEEPRRRTQKQKEEDAREAQRNSTIAPSSPYDYFRKYSTADRSEEVKGRLVKMYEDGIVIERETDGKFFTVLMRDLNRRDIIYLRKAKTVKGSAPFPSFIANRTKQITRLREQDKELIEQLKTANTSSKRGLTRSRERIQMEIKSLQAAVDQKMGDKKFVATPRKR